MTDHLTPAHHPEQDALARFAAGHLPPARSLMIAAHLPFCPDCRAAVRVHEAIGGVLLRAMPEDELSPNALNRALSRLDEPARPSAAAEPPLWLAPGVPMPAILRGHADASWRWLAPGVSRIRVRLDGPEDVYLLRVRPGAAMPEHGHHGAETTCVLAGGFTDATGHYGPGDLIELTDAIEHQPIADAREPCICLIAAEGRVRMKTWITRAFAAAMGA